ncbi:translation initiation factor IF-2 [Clostridium aminobutyricum]|uniref:Translation initiation factor IF-2 n=1 Tax=Clostridium aminobutyricum TaxID=33953 RepID=A0A939D6I4_CLOAM|nr:translation initiation factor IF-2 [Clostridium aminobutyricum]MBN7772142.1 translation initiation factor IF-2 [Clostridium aminobutyricum]
MTLKIHELAKELNMNSKELLEKINNMGIEAKSHMSVLSDIDAISVRNNINRSNASKETKIVKAAHKKVEKEEQQEEPRVVVKAAAKLTVSPETKPAKAHTQKNTEKQMTQKPPVGKPVVPKDMDASRSKPPVGKPVIPKEFEDKETAASAEQSKAAEAKTAEVKLAAKAEPITAVQPESGPQRLKIIKKYDPEQERIEKEKAEAKKLEERKAAAEKRAEGQRREYSNNRNEGNNHSSNRNDYQRRDYRSDNQGGQGAQGGQNGQRNDNRGDYQRNNDNRTGDRPARPNDRNDRPFRPNDRNDRPARPNDGNNRPARPNDGNNRPARPNDRNDRPARPNDRNDRPPYNKDRDSRDNRSGEKRPYQGGQRDGRSNDKPEIAPIINKPQIKRDEKEKEKERDKFAKLEKGKPKTAVKQRSLEKQPKPKKQQKVKVVEEPKINMEELPVGTKIVNVPITVAGFCEQLEISTSIVIMKLMKLGIMANINQNVDEDTVLVLAEELGVNVVIGKVEEEAVEEGLELFDDKEEDLKPRPPIVTVMGHVDHGKTSLLDAIRKTNVTASESGGITQHIGASEVTINGQKIVFLDTPGHEAFTAMRARGAHGADIAILVVAADDSVKPQTIESISHAKAAGVPIIVAINKIDKPGANPDRVMQDLTEHGILVEAWGGETIAVPVSAKSGEGIVNLLEMILLQSEMMELRANPSRLALGTVIEARLDKSKGPVATLLVTNGTLQSGMSVVAGTCAGRIRLMTNYKGDTIRKAGPSTAVEILGLPEVPEAGDVFNAVRDDKLAREIAETRRIKLREEVLARNSSTTLEKLFSSIQEGEIKELNLIIKGDVQGSVGALESSLEKLKNENVRVKILHSGVGTVTESDVMLAGTSGAVIIGFNVRPSTAVSAMAEREGIEIRTYRVIYNVIDDVEAAMKGMLDPEFKEEVLGKVEIRTTFKVPGVGTIGGAYVLEGKVVRNAEVRVVRDGIVCHEGKISSLKRFKDDAKEVMHGFECGIGIENYNDIKEGDIIECFHMVEVERK